jgi:hypothetical protein
MIAGVCWAYDRALAIYEMLGEYLYDKQHAKKRKRKSVAVLSVA